MKKLSLATLAITVAAAFAAASLAGNDDESQVLNQIAGYRQWTKVNADPVKVEVLAWTDASLQLREAPV